MLVKQFLFVSCPILFLILGGGCGYAFQGSGTVLPDDVKTISIRPVENDTTTPGLGPRFGEKIRSRFERYGVVKVVDSTQDADAELITRITGINTRVRDVTSHTDIALEYEVYMTISAELRRRNGQILYLNRALITRGSYGGTSDVVVTSSSAFAQGDIGADTLGGLGSREVSRGQEEQTVENLMDESARKLYLDAVAEEF
jgi:outer membrane lipopolysaccharide assembly protein LptE/RlpB